MDSGATSRIMRNVGTDNGGHWWHQDKKAFTSFIIGLLTPFLEQITNSDYNVRL